MYWHLLELEARFEDHGVGSGVITDSLVLERTVYEQRALVQPLPTAPQLANKQKRSRSPLDPVHTTVLALQILGLTHVWSTRRSGVIDSDDLLPLAAAVYMCIKPHLSPQQ